MTGERQRFEKFARDRGIDLCLSARDPEQYAFPVARRAWEAWQVAKAEQRGQLDTLVEETIDWLSHCGKFMHSMFRKRSTKSYAQEAAELLAKLEEWRQT